jgi:thiol-disulfide isomerase/thioredoxin
MTFFIDKTSFVYIFYHIYKKMNLKRPVSYLERSDFTDQGVLVNPQLNKKPLLVMLQAGFCGYCHQAKPAFQQFADEGLVTCATLQPDGDRQSEKDLQPIIERIYPNFKGYPSYILFTPDGRKIPHEGGRSTSNLREFVIQYI